MNQNEHGTHGKPLLREIVKFPVYARNRIRDDACSLLVKEGDAVCKPQKLPGTVAVQLAAVSDCGLDDERMTREDLTLACL